jgi:CDP-glucose 4,6-dehydratase
VVIVTSDKCYDNQEWLWGYRENDRLGGRDPYSNSKACAELVTQAYTDSFFPPERYGEHGVAVASARAGNVIGGGDWSQDRLLPDAMRAFVSGESLFIRSPDAVRPWQHVLEPLCGYLMLAQRLTEEGPRFNGPWNFGPASEGMASVKTVVDLAAEAWNQPTKVVIDVGPKPHEAGLLMIDATRSQQQLGWGPAFSLTQAVQMVVAFTRAWQQGADLRAHCLSKIAAIQAIPSILKQVPVK